VDAGQAARSWAETWAGAWPAKEVEAIAALYADDAIYRALAFREPDRGLAGVRRYLSESFAVEEDVECWFGEPIPSGDRSAVEWWATWVERGRRLKLAGATVLRFDEDSLVVDHRDYWNGADRREPPFEGWRAP
jgi:SnoaL-like domain